MFACIALSFSGCQPGFMYVFIRNLSDTPKEILITYECKEDSLQAQKYRLGVDEKAMAQLESYTLVLQPEVINDSTFRYLLPANSTLLFNHKGIFKGNAIKCWYQSILLDQKKELIEQIMFRDEPTSRFTREDLEHKRFKLNAHMFWYDITD